MQVLSNKCSLFFNIAKQLFYFKNWQILAIVRFRRKLGTGRSLDTDTEIRCPMSDVRHRIRCPATGKLVALPNNCSVFPRFPWQKSASACKLQAGALAGLGRKRTIAEIWAYFPTETRQLAGTCRLLGRAKSEQSQSSATFFGQLPGIYRATRANNYSVAQLHPPRENE